MLTAFPASCPSCGLAFRNFGGVDWTLHRDSFFFFFWRRDGDVFGLTKLVSELLERLCFRGSDVDADSSIETDLVSGYAGSFVEESVPPLWNLHLRDSSTRSHEASLDGHNMTMRTQSNYSRIQTRYRQLDTTRCAEVQCTRIEDMANILEGAARLITNLQASSSQLERAVTFGGRTSQMVIGVTKGLAAFGMRETVLLTSRCFGATAVLGSQLEFGWPATPGEAAATDRSFSLSSEERGIDARSPSERILCIGSMVAGLMEVSHSALTTGFAWLRRLYRFATRCRPCLVGWTAESWREARSEPF